MRRKSAECGRAVDLMGGSRSVRPAEGWRAPTSLLRGRGGNRRNHDGKTVRDYDGRPSGAAVFGGPRLLASTYRLPNISFVRLFFPGYSPLPRSVPALVQAVSSVGDRLRPRWSRRVREAHFLRLSIDEQISETILRFRLGHFKQAG